jgi:ABC-type transport system involved in multi-copper enzyme maturation permease subunit
MITAIRLEFLKLLTTRMWLAMLSLGTGFTVLVAISESARSGHGGFVPSLATDVGQRDILTTTGFGLLVSMIFGTMLVTTEFRHKTITDTYLDQPDRRRVLAAKVIVAGLGGALFGLLAAAITTAAAVGFTEARGYHFAYSAATVARDGAGAVLAAALLAAVGAGLGALLRSQLASAIAVFAWGFAVEQLLGAADKSLAPYLPVVAAGTMAGANDRATMPPMPSGITALPFAAVAALLAGLAVVLAAGASVTALRSDIS